MEERTKIGLGKAKRLIQAGRYEDARRILKQVKHPTADKWLLKIDELEIGDPFERQDRHLPDFTNKFIVSFIALFVFWVPGLILSTIFAIEARRAMHRYQQVPPYARALDTLNLIAWGATLFSVLIWIILRLLL